MRRAVPLLSASLLLVLSSCSGPSKIDRIKPGTEGYLMLRGKTSLPRGRHEKTNCGPETLCAALNYLGIAVSIDEVERAIYNADIQGATSVGILDFARRKGADPRISDNGGLWKLRDHLEADQPVMIEVTRRGLYHYFLVAGMSPELHRTVVFTDYGDEQLEMSNADLLEVWTPTRFRSITFSMAPAEKLIEQGFEFLDAGRYELAEERFNAALKLQPGHPRAFKGLGRVRIEQKRYPEAKECLERALEGLPGDAEVLNNLADVILTLKGDSARAVDLTKKCQAVMKEQVAQLETELKAAPPGTAERIQQDLKQAKERLFYYGGTRANALEAAGRPEDSIEARLETLNWTHLEEDDPDARGRRHLEIARTYRKLGKPEKAAAHFEKALGEAKTEEFRAQVRKESESKRD